MRPRVPYRFRFITFALAALTLLVASPPAHAAGNPDFDAVTWTPLTCDNADLISHTGPLNFDFVGDATFPPAYFAHDAMYLYFRYRMNDTPANSGGFAQGAWTALMQVPSGDPFQYQYELALNGKTNTIEIWQNTVASDISFSPLFHDTPEVKLFSQKYDLANGSTVNTTPLARSLPAGDGSNFGSKTDYFLDFAFPVSVMISNGLVSSADDLGDSIFFPATATDPNNYNKGYLNCPFLPGSTLSIAKTVSPTSAPANVTTRVDYTIVVENEGPGIAKGIEIDDPALPAYMTNISASVSASDPSVVWTLVSTNPLQVKVDTLPNGATVTVDLSADAKPGCGAGDFTNTATVWGVNSMEEGDSAVLDAGVPTPEVCDGVDNDCDGVIDDGGNTLCNDGNACHIGTCNGLAGCSYAPIPDCVACSTDLDCDDGNGCTTDACSAAGTCTHTTPDPTCVPCSSDAQCNDSNGCTTDSCSPAGTCTHVTPDPTCIPCTTAATCNDHDGCTTDTCNAAGICEHSAPPGCTPCTTAAQCDDSNPCTTDACGEDGSCRITAIPGCERCTTTADCNDHVDCTTDTCAGGVCHHDRTPQCDLIPENCSDGIDNDGDGLVDCADPDCANAPECRPHEICGNCIDDDGDGLVDGEDPDCCGGAAAWMNVRRLMLKPGSASVTGRPVHGNRLRLKTRYTKATPGLFDPAAQDTEVQISDGQGQIFCTTVPAKFWKHPHRRVYRFKDKSGTFAGGLKNGRFKMKRNGKILFATRGKKMDVRSTDGQNVKITVRVGNVCAEETRQLRSTKKALVFP